METVIYFLILQCMNGPASCTTTMYKSYDSMQDCDKELKYWRSALSPESDRHLLICVEWERA